MTILLSPPHILQKTAETLRSPTTSARASFVPCSLNDSFTLRVSTITTCLHALQARRGESLFKAK